MGVVVGGNNYICLLYRMSENSVNREDGIETERSGNNFYSKTKKNYIKNGKLIRSKTNHIYDWNGLFNSPIPIQGNSTIVEIVENDDEKERKDQDHQVVNLKIESIPHLSYYEYFDNLNHEEQEEILRNVKFEYDKIRKRKRIGNIEWQIPDTEKYSIDQAKKILSGDVKTVTFPGLFSFLRTNEGLQDAGNNYFKYVSLLYKKLREKNDILPEIDHSKTYIKKVKNKKSNNSISSNFINPITEAAGLVANATLTFVEAATRGGKRKQRRTKKSSPKRKTRKYVR